MSSEQPYKSPNGQEPKKSKTALIVIIVLAVLAIPVVCIFGLAAVIFFNAVRLESIQNEPFIEVVPLVPESVLPAQTPKVATPDATAIKKHMTSAQLALGDSVENSVGMIMIPIPAGEFQMGSPDSDKAAQPREKPQHRVEITEPFYLSVYEVTQQQYEKVMGSRPWQGKEYGQEEPDYPATFVSWDDAVEFCRKLSEQEGVDYRLPTEAEWEFTCRAGTTTVYSFGDDASQLGQHAWYNKNTFGIGEKYAHRIGQKPPNPWGLYDMHGNVYEWCQDRYENYGSEKGRFAKNPGRVVRGGSFSSHWSLVRSADRSLYLPNIRSLDNGFRPARDLSP